jgi:hypothetical protein
MYALVKNVTETDPIFKKLRLAQQLFVKNSYTELHENPTNDLRADRSQTDRRAG